jgi:hypothetical protein
MVGRRSRISCGLLALVLPLFVGARTARADGPSSDTSYGRLESDLAASLAVGASFGPRAPRAAVDVRLRYLWTAGVYATYEDGSLLGAAPDPRRLLSTGLELRPLFLARWLEGKETGQRFLDLTLDSLALELGAVFVEPRGRSFGSRPGLAAGLGLELPILGPPSGPVLGVHGGARWSDAALAGSLVNGPSDRALFLLLTLGWQQGFGAHVVDLGDRAPR